MTTTPNDPRIFRRLLTRNVAFPLALGVLSAGLFVGLILYLLAAISVVERTDQVITRAYALQNLDLDMESGLRGYLLTGDARYLEPYERSLASMASARSQLREMVASNPAQRERLEQIAALQERWNRFAVEQVELKRRDSSYSGGAQIDQGRQIKRAIRDEFSEFVALERRLRLERVQEANRNAIWAVTLFVAFMLGVGVLLAWRGRRDLLALSGSYEHAFQEQQRQAEVLQAQAWLREGQTRLGERLAGEQALSGVAHGALEFLSRYLGIAVGVVYIPQEDGSFVRAGTWGWSPEFDSASARVPAERTLIAECAAQRRQLTLEAVPADYLRVSSALGHSTVHSVLIAPIEHEGRLSAVLEVGFLRPLAERDGELLRVAGGIVGASIEAARTRRRLQDMLEETQQLNEELQVQQEELRTANEELEEHSRALKESQANLENQQAELEQTNLRLSEQTEQLADQRDELREAQDQLQARAEELQRASRYKSEFLANMSHELRTPLNSALILSRLLADNAAGNLSEEQVRFAESIYSSGNDLLNLINDVLDIAKVEAGKLEVRPETAPVAGLLSGLRAMFEPLTRRKGLQFELTQAPDAPAQLWTDRQRIEQILKNLLSNAVKFTDQGSVRVTVRGEDGQVAFEVQDSGIGIEPSQQGLIFEAFRQADGTVGRRYGGTGLGLSISRDLAHLLGGSLSVSSEPGQGSTFVLRLPLQYEGPREDAPASLSAAAPAPFATVPTPPAPKAPPATAIHAAPAFPDDREQPADTRRTVLVVEDDEKFAHILYDLAHELGYRCLVAHHAEQGLQLAAQHQPQAVLLDMRLPDGSGLSVLQALKDDPRTRHIPVHVLSVEDRAETALQMGAVGYALKPATREQLHEVFDRLEAKLSQKLKRVLLVEDDQRQRESVARLIGEKGVEITAVAQGSEALQALSEAVFDCMIIDLKLPDMSGQQLLERMASGESRSFPPVIVYTGRNLDRQEEAQLMRYSRSIIIKGARSPERLLDEVTLFLHQVEADLSSERQKMLRTARNRDKAFEGRRLLVVDDDVRNIFALSSALEQKGAQVDVARNGVEALQQLNRGESYDLVLMDIMMPEMDGYTAMREIRRSPRWQKLPIIAITAKAMRDDQDKCLAAGASDYLAKPIELERLFSLIRVWMPKL
ncbi:response regulator [Ramlibacter rhizophilus]|uniref:Virulence sensor protein BvgS n=1 Tax=Ramlibacter rhizophilus TaxID=1781167 RepID=A0A4Z0BME0_9BURK|nr:response regulator [Ramlibacter rhizophilus]TFY99569.1 response regulator [Ramlibacter rhizophilus]